MIDPRNIVRHYTDPELEELLMFCILVAGKQSKATAIRLHNVLNFLNISTGQYVFSFLRQRSEKEIADILQLYGIGCFRQKAKTLSQASRRFCFNCSNLRKASVEDLESIWGIGPKTSRFFRMCHNPMARHAALDTHILRYMRDQGIDAPRSTPKGRKYIELEQKFLDLVPENKTPAEFDLEIWNTYSKA